MNKKSKSVYVCSDCGEEFSKWQGRCFNCGAWETITELRQPAVKKAAGRPTSGPLQPSQIKPLSECESTVVERITTGFGEIDRVLGGGVVPGAMMLLGGDPGIGKSTLLLQIMTSLAGREKRVLYISGEESSEQISLHAERLGISGSKLFLLTETNLERITDSLATNQLDVVVVDSIQTIYSEGLESAPGSVSQVRECAAHLLRHAKENHIATFLVGHVTKEGAIAGPRVLEHMVDTVLSFEGDANYQYRILRAAKNRFGPSGEIALMSMSDNGLHEVVNCADLFLLNRDKPQVGTAFVPVVEGSRILAVELQALVNQTHFGLPQRVASGINPKKLSLLIAVLERYSGISLGEFDIFFNIAGGLTIAEPAIDLGITAALISSHVNRPLPAERALLGEIGLGGEIRPVNQMSKRLKELARLGFKHCIVPPPGKHSDWAEVHKQMRLISCGHVQKLREIIFEA
jgi:DNA repair protein RadA/Sms